MKQNSQLTSFILESRRRGYDDTTITKALLKGHWPKESIQEAFLDIKNQTPKKVKITKGSKIKTFVYLDTTLITQLEKRAQKNLFTLPEQIEDILRRSVLSQKKKSSFSDKVDDKFLSIFSRRRRGK